MPDHNCEGRVRSDRLPNTPLSDPMRRETSRVSFVMCPFCVRGVVPSSTTYLLKRDVPATEHSGEHGPDMVFEAALYWLGLLAVSRSFDANRSSVKIT